VDTVELRHMLSHSSGIGDPPYDSATGRRADLLADGFTFDADCEPHPIFGAADVGLDYDAVHPHHPGAGAFARAEDLLAIGRALLVNDGALLHPATVAALQRSRTDGLPVFSPAPGRPGETWGLGFRLRQNSPGLLAGDGYGHSGWGGAEFWVHPEQGVCFTLLTNVMEPARFGVNIDRLHNAVVAGTR
jgi:CubicO group peptidase (beta-lactamase class C family)